MLSTWVKNIFLKTLFYETLSIFFESDETFYLRPIKNKLREKHMLLKCTFSQNKYLLKSQSTNHTNNAPYQRFDSTKRTAQMPLSFKFLALFSLLALTH